VAVPDIAFTIDEKICNICDRIAPWVNVNAA